MNRALRAATVGVLLISPVAVSACSAGQIPQTSTQNRDKTGPMAAIGSIYLRQVEVAFPTGGSYAPGDDAELHMAIVNTGPADELVSISGKGFTGVRVSGTGTSSTGTPTTAGAAGTSATTSAPPSSAATPTPSLGPFGSQTPSTPLAPPPSAVTPTSAAAAGSAVGLPLPGDTTLFLGQNAPHVFLVGLTSALTPGQTIPVTLTFRNAGTLTMPALVSGPTSYVPDTSTFSFSPGNDQAGGGPG